MAGYDFNRVSSYGLYPRDSDFTQLQSLPYYQRSRIEIAIENKMHDLAMNYQPVEQADVIITYFVVQSDPSELWQYNKQVRACLGCTSKEQRQLTKGLRSSTLIIDILDGQTERSVYRAFSKLELNPKDNSDEQQQMIVAAVDNILNQLPNKR
ncbi:DUF4136 domain-containing protein [Thalassotalea maritima]|uniref:DUF4136 domain-containing protein n=1 Tax=Thalassotalea maritima TaxID=3242416 RepID=UPI0035288E0E